MPARTRVLAILVGAFLAVQLVVPAFALLGPRPSRFGWHMYSALPPVPTVWAVPEGGPAEEVDITGLFAAPRAEIDYALVARTHLCGRLDARWIRIQPRDGAPVETIEC